MLTELKVKNLKPREREYTESDRDGLSVRVRPNGRKTFQYRYHLPGQRNRGKRFIYGDYPAMTLAEARDLHILAVKKVRNGIDLNVERKNRILKEIAEPTVRQAYEEYKDNYLSTLKSPEQQIGHFKRDILPALGSLKLKEIKRRQLIVILDRIKNRGAPVMANRVLASIKKFFKFCVERGMIENSPAVMISKSSAGGVEKSKDRYLSESEIKIFMDKIDGAAFSRQIQCGLKILLLTGQRISELFLSEWSEVDIESAVWTIPAEKTKTKETNRVPLSELALDLFQELKLLSGESRFVMQTNQGKLEKPIVYRSVDRAVSREREHFGLDHWTPHDLRRTVNTHLNELGVLPHIVERILNHKLQGVQAVYNRAEYWDEKVDAMKLWAERIKQICAGEKVVQISREAVNER